MCTYIHIRIYPGRDPVRRRHNRTHADWQVICDRISERFTPQMVTSVMEMNYKMTKSNAVNAPCHFTALSTYAVPIFISLQGIINQCTIASELFLYTVTHANQERGTFQLSLPACPPSPWWEAMAGDAAPPPLPGSCFSALFTLALSVVTN